MTTFINASMPLTNFTANAGFVNATGYVLFDLEEKRVGDLLVPILILILTNEVQSLEVYEVHFEVEWHSLPAGYKGGRRYTHSGVIPYSIADLVIEISQVTSDILTPNQNLQVQERIFANITVTFPEVKQY